MGRVFGCLAYQMVFWILYVPFQALGGVLLSLFLNTRGRFSDVVCVVSSLFLGLSCSYTRGCFLDVVWGVFQV